MSDLISIIVPTRNRSAILRQALRCAQSQSWRNTEIIVVDEGSTDDTAAVLARDFSEIKVVRHQEAKGLSAARNAGVAAAAGDWLHFWDDDDFMHPNHLEDLLTASRAVPPQSIVAGRSRNFAVVSGELVLSPIVWPAEQRSDVETLNEIIDPRRQRTITHSAILWPRRVFDRLDWDPALAFNEDFDLFVRAVLAGWHIVGRPVGKYYIHLHTGPRITTTPTAARLRSPALSWSKWAGLLQSEPAFAACGPALREGLMAQLLATALVPAARDLAPQLERAFRAWGGTRHYLVNPPRNSIKRGVLNFLLQVGGPATVERFLALAAKLRPAPPSFVDGFRPPATDEDRDDAALIRRFLALPALAA